MHEQQDSHRQFLKVLNIDRAKFVSWKLDQSEWLCVRRENVVDQRTLATKNVSGAQRLIYIFYTGQDLVIVVAHPSASLVEVNDTDGLRSIYYGHML